MYRTVAMATVIGTVICWSALAFGQTTKDPVTVLPDTNITGVYQKPSAFYILQPGALQYEALKVEQTFIDALKKTIEEEDVF